MTRIRDTLDRLGLEGDQPTKRIVLRNMLARQLQGAFDASTAAGTAARRVYPSDHAEIAAGVTGLAGIRGQVEDARARIAANVRQAVLAEKRAAAEEMLSLARAEFDRLTRRATELDDAIAAATEQAVMLLTRSSLESNDQRQQLALVRERGELLEQLASIRARQAIQLASAPPPVQYIPASVVALPRITPPTLMRAGALAAIPLLAGGAIACSWILFLWWRRSRQTADAYVRMLTAPREGDAPPAQ